MLLQGLGKLLTKCLGRENKKQNVLRHGFGEQNDLAESPALMVLGWGGNKEQNRIRHKDKLLAECVR